MTELYQSLSHSKWDCKYHVVPCCIRCIRAQTAAESHLRSDTPTSGTDFPWAGAAKGMPDSRRASDAGPCAHVHRHSPQAPGGFGDRVSQREERHCHPLRGGLTIQSDNGKNKTASKCCNQALRWTITTSHR